MNNKIKIYIVLFTLLWLLLVLYPNPLKLGQSIYRIFEPPIDAKKVMEDLDTDFSNTPIEEIESFVLSNIPYQYDWVTYNMPWYYPDIDEIIANNTGDCKSRMVYFASILEGLNIPYQIRYSIDHFWVDYFGKEDNIIERDELSFYSQDDGFQLPDIQWDITINTYRNFWDYMPLDKKILFSLGFIIFPIIGGQVYRREGSV